MEACMMKPEARKKPKPRPNTAPPKPPEMERYERPEKPAPVAPLRPTDAGLGHTQHRVKRLAAVFDVQPNGNVRQQEKSSETPVIPPRPSEKEMNSTAVYSQHTRAEVGGTQKSAQANNPRDEADFKSSHQRGVPGMFQRNQKGKAPTFTAYLSPNADKENPDEVQVKQATSSKPGGLKGVMKGLQFKSTPKTSRDQSSDPQTEEAASEKEQSAEKNLLEKNAEPKQEKGGFFSGILKKPHKSSDGNSSWASRDPSPEPGAEEGGAEKQQSAEKNKQERNAETKQDKGGLLTGMFRKTPKDKSLSTALSISKADSDSDDTDEEKKKEHGHEKGGFFSGLLKKSNKPAADDVTAQDNLSVPSELSASSDSLSENGNKDKGGIFSGMFKKKPAEASETDQDEESLHGELSGSKGSLNENLQKEKGFFSGMRRKPAKTPGEATPPQEKESLQAEKSASNDSLSENSKEKGGVFSGMFKKSPKPSEGPRLPEGTERLHGELSASTDSLENKEKGGLFSGLLRKTPKTAGENSSTREDISGSTDSLSDAANSKERKSQDDEGSTEGLTDNKEKGGIFSGLFKKPHKPAEAAQSDEDGESQKERSASNEDLSENTSKEKHIFTNIFKRPQKQAEMESDSTENLLSGSSENLTDQTVSKEKKGGLAEMLKKSASIEFDLFDEESGGLFSGLRKKTPKASGDEAAAEDKDSQKELSASTENLFESNTPKEKNIFSGMFKKTQKPADEESGEEKKLSASYENLSEGAPAKEKSGGLAGIFKKSPKPAKRSTTAQDPLSDSKRSASVDSLTDAGEDDPSARDELSASNENLESAGTKEKKGGFAGMFRRTPKNEEQQAGEDMAPPTGGGLRRKRTIKKKQRVVSFRVKKTLPRMPKFNLTSQSSDKMPVLEEAVELQEMNPGQENPVEVEVEPVEMADYPTDEARLQAEQENSELMDWWNSVKGWTEWNETSNFGTGDEEIAMEQAADRVYMAARVFVHLFNQHGASLQHRILELLALADAADHFHKKTTTAAVGGGVASVAGSITTITGLILAPFTFGASIIVTAVGIGVATAGSIASATANITDTVHSNMDRKKLEKMIQEYQDEIKDIRECLEFVQEGMDTLQEWDFEKYSQSAASKAMNHNLKHVMKEGGRAGKALMINTDKLISTVQVLGAAGGVAKAAQAISVTTGVMSALFLALDIFFLAKDSHKLRKGAKTKFASKIRDVCKDLQDGLLELNKVKTQLQKTMDGIEVEEYEEFEEVEVEVDDELESDPKKLAELEQELDLLEEKLDKKIEEEQQKKKEMEIMKANEKKEKEVQDEKKDKEEKSDKGEGSSESKSETDEEEQKKSKEEPSKEQVQKGSKRKKETENWITAGKHERERETVNDTVINKTTAGLRQEVRSREELRPNERSTKAYSEWVKPETESVRRRSSREDEGGVKPEWKSVHAERETESRSTRRHSSRSDREEESGGRHEEHRRSRHTDRGDDRTESWRRRAEEERGVKDWRAETKGADHGRTESHRGHETSGSRRERSERERGGSRQDSTRSHHSERGGSRREYETAGGEEGEKEGETERRREHGGSHRRGSDGDREHHHSRRGSRPRSSALLDDGLYI